jgi:hypothetical protein
MTELSNTGVLVESIYRLLQLQTNSSPPRFCTLGEGIRVFFKGEPEVLNDR